MDWRDPFEPPYGDLGPDPVIEAYEKGVDRTLIRENLRRSPEERLDNLVAMKAFWDEAQRARRERWRSTLGRWIRRLQAGEVELVVAELLAIREEKRERGSDPEG